MKKLSKAVEKAIMDDPLAVLKAAAFEVSTGFEFFSVIHEDVDFHSLIPQRILGLTKKPTKEIRQKYKLYSLQIFHGQLEDVPADIRNKYRMFFPNLYDHGYQKYSERVEQVAASKKLR